MKKIVYDQFCTENPWWSDEGLLGNRMIGLVSGGKASRLGRFLVPMKMFVDLLEWLE